jgi:hypothetical protein
MSKMWVIEKKKGVELRRVDWFGQTLGYELWVDDEFFNRYNDLKTAKRFFKDFASAV